MFDWSGWTYLAKSPLRSRLYFESTTGRSHLIGTSVLTVRAKIAGFITRCFAAFFEWMANKWNILRNIQKHHQSIDNLCFRFSLALHLTSTCQSFSLPERRSSVLVVKPTKPIWHLILKQKPHRTNTEGKAGKQNEARPKVAVKCFHWVICCSL